MNTDTVNEAEFDRVLLRELEKRIKLTSPPSKHLQAWRDYERQKFGYLGRNAPRHNMGYNLWVDSTRTLRDCHRMLTDTDFRKGTGFTAKTIPRRAICRIAEAIGYRYMRGLELIQPKLNEQDLERFESERAKFRSEFECAADKAHAMNNMGQDPAAAHDIVQMFHDELLALCPWIAAIGLAADAEKLKQECQYAMSDRAVQT